MGAADDARDLARPGRLVESSVAEPRREGAQRPTVALSGSQRRDQTAVHAPGQIGAGYVCNQASRTESVNASSTSSTASRGLTLRTSGLLGSNQIDPSRTEPAALRCHHACRTDSTTPAAVHGSSEISPLNTRWACPSASTIGCRDAAISMIDDRVWANPHKPSAQTPLSSAPRWNSWAAMPISNLRTPAVPHTAPRLYCRPLPSTRKPGRRAQRQRTDQPRRY